MTNVFTLKPMPEVHFGAGRLALLPDILSSFGTRALLITGGESFHKTDGCTSLLERLTRQHIDYFIEHISSEPSPDIVDRIASVHRDNKINVVVAIGGGSVLDGGKAVSAMLVMDGSVADYLEGVGSKTPDGRKIPFVAVPTTSGTGSEMTCNAVVSSVGRDGFKKSLRHDNYIPDIALIDPELTMQCPLKVTVNCSLDAFSQLVESYLSVKASIITDDLAFGAISKVKDALMPVCAGKGTLEDRASMSYGAFISGITLTHAGLGVIHGFASVIGGNFQIPHGVVCGTLMAAGNEVTLRKLRQSGNNTLALEKYANLGRLFCQKERMTSDYYQNYFIEILHKMTADLRIDLLSKFGVMKKDVSSIAQKTGCKNNPIKLDQEDLEMILIQRLAH